MFLDAQLLFSNQQALTTTALSTNTIDLGVARNLGDGVPMALVLVPNVSAKTSAGNETYEVDLQTAVDVAFTSPVIVSQTIIPGAQLAVGSKVVIAVPIGKQLLQYIRLNYVLGGTSPTLTIEAFLQPLHLVEKVTYYLDKSPIS